jgi:Protein of unknown function (DUF3515)
MLGLSFLAFSLAGCDSEPVEISSTTPATADLDRCRHLIDAVPETVSDEHRREVTPDDALGAAWGDPAIVLTCGGTWQVPAAANCQEVDGVDWYAPESQFADQDADVVLTTIGYSPVVRVEVPARYRPPAAAMVDLAPAIKKTLKHVSACS